MEKEILTVSQSSVAQALAADYFCIYYVNIDNDHFIEYSSSPEYKKLGLPRNSEDFNLFSKKIFDHVVFPDDRDRFREEFTKANILEGLENRAHFTMTFRMIMEDRPTYVHLKVTRMIGSEGNHVVVGISNIDDQMRQQDEYRQSEEQRITFSKVAQALAGDFFSIYVIDPDTNRFIEYSATEQYDELGIEKGGEDFFNMYRRNMHRVIFEGDKERFMGIFYKEKIMSILERDGSFTMKYRLMFGDTPIWVSMKATLLTDQDGRHLIIGTNNIDAQMKREAEYQQHMAEARNQAKNDFLANMSHDMRTPMNAIVGYTNIAVGHLDDHNVVRDSLAKIGSSSHFLLSLINDILDMSKIESGKMTLNAGPCDLSVLFSRIEDITFLQARDKNLNISYEKSRIKHYHVYGDELRIEQVLINIISNAIKYTPEGRSVDIIAEEESTGERGKNKYRFIVRDTGVGISEEYLPHIFESFTREQNTTVNRIQGTGLGLAITARVVEQMGGRISVKSRPGEGSEFTVELILEEMTDHSVNKEVVEDTGSPDLTGKHVLVVEDNDINAEIAIMILSQYGMEVEHAADGQIALDMINQRGSGYFDIVLMDIQMPVMNGYEAARAIRASDDDYCRKLSIIAMSANAYEDDVKACLDAGMNGHIAKPFDPADLIKLIQREISG